MSKRPKLAHAYDAGSSMSLAARAAFSPQIIDSPPYVIDVLSFSHYYAAASSDSTVALFDRASLKRIRDLPASSNGSLKSIAKTSSAEEALVATYENGCVEIFDMRSQASDPQIKLKGANGAPCLCAAASSSNTYLASGTELFQHEATIRIHDLRSPNKHLHTYIEAHSDDISTLAFHPSEDHLLLSGAMDGLSSTIDVRIADEDDAILHTANVGASLSKVGWTTLPGRQAWQGTFALTNMETLSLYDAGDEMSLVKDYGDVREVDNSTWQTHYVIDCTSTEGGLLLAAGQREGQAALLRVPFEGDWGVDTVFPLGHTDIVRACRLDLQAGSAVTCGEDGQVCLWKASGSEYRLSGGSGSLKAPAPKESKAARFAPY